MREKIKESLMTADEVLDSMYGSFIVGEKNKENGLNGIQNYIDE